MAVNNEANDILGRPVEMDMFVCHYNNIYKVHAVGRYGMLKMMLVDKSKTTKTKQASSKDCLIVPSEDIVIWLLKRDK